MQRACDSLYVQHISLIWGPGRHGVGHNIFAYHHDPDKQIVELFTELDIMLSEDLGYFEPRPWHEDVPQKPKVWRDTPEAVNHWGPMPYQLGMSTPTPTFGSGVPGSIIALIRNGS